MTSDSLIPELTESMLGELRSTTILTELSGLGIESIPEILHSLKGGFRGEKGPLRNPDFSHVKIVSVVFSPHSTAEAEFFTEEGLLALPLHINSAPNFKSLMTPLDILLFMLSLLHRFSTTAAFTLDLGQEGSGTKGHLLKNSSPGGEL